ncbi:hypothetical protein PYW08_009352 [Mythimna loreyi]|uniref:Uncharacterized protein n=1 Tax=Mythimna loreyi TaxID=667449 RepID=A0ACC2Q8X8_9NEOP|nr:hypothetical protein PYW08_009352 [Mythimna loreyi]
MFEYKYLSKEHLKGFNKYKYSAIDTSPLSNYVMHPSWNTIVKVIPRSVAPNLITFAGFVCMVAVVLILTAYDYDLYAAGGRPGLASYDCDIPSWVFTFCGVMIFLAYNLDGLDGKQARRIGVSGPLGELFDHGLDSYIVFLIPYSLISIFGRDPVFSVTCLRGLLIIISVVMNFYVSHCEKYNTGTLYLPWSYDLSMWVCPILFLVAGVYGPACYKQYVFGDVTFAQALEVVIHVMGFITTYPVSIYNVYLSYRSPGRTSKKYPILEATKPIWSMLVMTAAVIFWAVKSPNNILEQHPRAFILMYGTLFSNISCRLIIAEMSHRRCELLSWMTWPLLKGIMISLQLPQLESLTLHILLILFVVSHVHYGVCVVRQICAHLKISCFTVPYEKRK